MCDAIKGKKLKHVFPWLFCGAEINYMKSLVVFITFF